MLDGQLAALLDLDTCRACNQRIIRARLWNENIALNPEPDPTGRYLLLKDGRKALQIPDEDLVLLIEGTHPRIVPETAARRFREHRTTCEFRFPMYSVAGSVRPQQQNPFLKYREKLRQVKLEVERNRYQ